MLTKRRHRRGTKVHAEPMHDGRPVTFGRRYGAGVIPDADIDQTPYTGETDLYRSVYFDMLRRDPLMVCGMVHPDDRQR